MLALEPRSLRPLHAVLLLSLCMLGCPSGPVPRERAEGAPAEQAALGQGQQGQAGQAPGASGADGLPAGHPAVDGLPAGHPAVDRGLPSGHPAVDPGLPAGHPAVGAGAPATDGWGPAEEPVAHEAPTVPPLAGVTWDAPPAWVSSPPSSAMRAAEYASRDGQVSLVVFHFPEMRGTVRDNIERWKGQFDEAARAEARVDTREVAGLSVTVLDIQGANAGIHGGSDAPAPQQRMLAATVIAPGGFVFFKLVGPPAAVARERAGFDALIASLRQTGARPGGAD